MFSFGEMVFKFLIAWNIVITHQEVYLERDIYIYLVSTNAQTISKYFLLLNKKYNLFLN
jgi:hypothetical protein